MTTIRIEMNPKDPPTFPKGQVNYAMVDATTEEDIDRQIKEAEAREEMARYTRQLRRLMNLSQIEFADSIKVSP